MATTFKDRIMSAAADLIIERPAKNKSVQEFVQGLEKNRDAILARIRKVPNTPRNHSVITHIIGIERWAQRRIKCALGEAFVKDEYNPYRPPKDVAWDALPKLFEDTRRETIALVQKLSPTALNTRVNHNTFGDISVRGWLNYIQIHGDGESKKLR
jgi:hypothetical protein